MLTIVAGAGCGKSIAARQIVESSQRPFGWLNVDSLDADPATFWRHLISALRWAQPAVDERPELLLADRGADDSAFLAALISAIETDGIPATIVIDGVSGLRDRAVLDGLALLIERVGDIVRFVFVGRFLPELPLGTWRARNWLCEIDDQALAFTEAETVAALWALPDVRLHLRAAAALRASVEGWVTGTILAARSVSESDDPAGAARRISGTDRLFVEYFRSELLDQLTPDERRVALSLSVLPWFDAQLCCDLLGSESVAVAHGLRLRHGFLAGHDTRTGVVRLHPLLREMMVAELLWLDPALRANLHRRAAALLRQREDLRAATTGVQPLRVVTGEALTPRELRLLQFLPSHLSYAEIGERLFISVNTVKTNLKALYRKLDASTRAEAVEAAAYANLLANIGPLDATASEPATTSAMSAR